MTGHQDGTEALERDPVPPDRDANALVAAILDQANTIDELNYQPGWNDMARTLGIKISIIQGDAERLAVLLADRDAAAEGLVSAAEAVRDDSYLAAFVVHNLGWRKIRDDLVAALARAKEGK